MFTEDRLDPELRAPFLALPPTTADGDLPSVRRAHAAGIATAADARETDPQVLISDLTIPGPAGNGTLRLRNYRPVSSRAGALGAFVWMHGGGFTQGAPEQDDFFCRRVCSESNCVVFSTDYRLAPEHPFPAALEDCYSALLWVAGGQAGTDVDCTRIAVGGASAGGGLAAGLALLARDRGGPEILFQFLKYPCVDDRHETASSRDVTDTRTWNRERSIRAWRAYLGPESDIVSPYAAPARAVDLSRLPAAYVYAAELDLLRDEAVEYARRLLLAGISVEMHLVRGTFHGSEGVAPTASVSRRNVDEFVAVIRRALESRHPASWEEEAASPPPKG